MPDIFKPIVAAANIEKALPGSYVLANLTNQNTTGSVTKLGEQIQLNGIARPTVTLVTDPKAQLTFLEHPTKDSTLLTVNKLGIIRYIVDETEVIQGQPGYETALSVQSADAFGRTVDTYLSGFYAQAGYAQALASCTGTTVLDSLFACQEKLLMNDVSLNEICAVIGPRTWTRLATAIQNIKTDNAKLVDNGYLATVRGINIYLSNCLTVDGSSHEHNLVMTKQAIGYYNQVGNVKKYQESDYIGDIYRAEILFGGAVVRAKELVDWDIAAFA